MLKHAFGASRRFLILLVLGGMLALLGACQKNADPDTAARSERPSTDHLVEVVDAQRIGARVRHERPGSLRYRRLVRIFNQEEGRITQLDLFEGDQVAPDALLVALEDDLLRAEIDKARAMQAQAQLDLKRMEDLRERRAVSESEVSLARTTLTVAQAELRVLETRLAFTRIRAPFAGVVIERRVEPGDFATKNSHLLTLADPDSLVAEVYASELILPHLSLGDLARLRIDALGDQDFEARILRIHPRLETTSRQGIVELALAPIPDGARAGQFVRATLETASVERLLIPFRALRRDRAGEFIWLLEDGKAIRRTVRSGLQIAENVEILDGLVSGEPVITRGFLGLSAGKTVKIPSH